MKIKTQLFICFFFAPVFLINLFSQNCNAFLYYGDSLQYEACIVAEKRAGKYQFSRAYQEALDESLEICDYFSFAYRHKSVAYLKSGDFLTWKKLMDKAVELDPIENLSYRGWCRYQFFRDYKGAIKDIEKLDSLIDYNIGFSQDGAYHLNIAKALCYKALGQKEKAIAIIEKQLKEEDHSVGLYDYLHLGVLYLELGKHEEAIKAFNLQSSFYEYADNQYYLALAEKQLGKKETYKNHLVKAKELYLKREYMFGVYTERQDKVYLQEIEKELELADQNVPQY